jgi:hypothetical protein
MNIVEYNDSLVDTVKECTDSNQELFKNFNTNEASVDSIVQSIQDSVTICQNSQVKASQL